MPDTEELTEAELAITAPDKSCRTVKIATSPFLIGRGLDTGNHLALDDPRISRQCAAIVSEASGFILEDHGHRRGIFVNGKRVSRATLAGGDVITFGLDQSYEIEFRSRSSQQPLQNMLTMIGTSPSTHGTSAGLGKLTLLLEATSLLHSDLPLESVLGTMLDHAISITHADRGLLMEADRSGSLRVRLARGSHGVSLNPGDVTPSQTALRQAMQQKRCIITEDLNVADHALQAAQSIVAQSLRAVIAIPLYVVSRSLSADSPAASDVGQFLGMIYLDSRRPTAFSRLDRQILDALALQAASILDSARLVEQERQRQKLEQELNIARDIQQALIPHGFRDFPYFGITGIHTPCSAVGGDYFDAFQLSEDRSVIVVADVSGKGIGAALLTTMLQGAFSSMTPGTDPVQVLDQLNRFLCNHSEVGRYATMFFGVLNRLGHLVFINAGHPSPLMLRAGHVTSLVTEGSFPVGLVPEATFDAKNVQLLPGDTLVLFSDGVTEAMDQEEQLFGDTRLCDAIAGKQDLPLEDLQKEILNSVQAFTRGATQNDDITVLLVRYQPESQASSS